MSRVAVALLAMMLAPATLCGAAGPDTSFPGADPLQASDGSFMPTNLNRKQSQHSGGTSIEPMTLHASAAPETADVAPRLSAARDVIHDSGTAMYNGRDRRDANRPNSKNDTNTHESVLEGQKAASPKAVAAQLGERGLKVRRLTESERAEYGVSEGGVMVVAVGQGAALKAGFKQGDVVLMLDGVSLKGPAQFRQLIRDLPHDRPVPVLVHRPNNNLFLPLGNAAP